MGKRVFLFFLLLLEITHLLKYLIWYFIEFEYNLLFYRFYLHIFCLMFLFLNRPLGRGNFDSFNFFFVFLFLFEPQLNFYLFLSKFEYRYWSSYCLMCGIFKQIETNRFCDFSNDFCNLLWFSFCHYTLFNLQLLSLGHTW